MSKRRSRHKRVSEDNLPAFRLTPRDRQIIKAVNDCQTLRTSQVQTLFFGSPSPAYDRLQKLYHYGYLERYFITQVAQAPASSPMIYTISKLGASVLAATFGYSKDDFNFVGRAVRNWQTLQHILAVGDFQVAVMRAARELDGFRLVEWVAEKSFRADPDEVYVTGARGRQRRKPVIPDGYLVLETPQGLSRSFVEVDRGTEGLEQFRSQIEVYQEYMRSGYQERYKTTSLRILVITNSDTRLTSLAKTIARTGGRERYWLTTKKRITPETVFTAPIWQKLTDDNLHAFVELETR